MNIDLIYQLKYTLILISQIPLTSTKYGNIIIYKFKTNVSFIVGFNGLETFSMKKVPV